MVPQDSVSCAPALGRLGDRLLGLAAGFPLGFAYSAACATDELALATACYHLLPLATTCYHLFSPGSAPGALTFCSTVASASSMRLRTAMLGTRCAPMGSFVMGLHGLAATQRRARRAQGRQPPGPGSRARLVIARLLHGQPGLRDLLRPRPTAPECKLSVRHPSRGRCARTRCTRVRPWLREACARARISAATVHLYGRARG